MKRPRAGFSLIETLTVITVLLVLTAMILSTVLSARDANRRAGCVNNLRQIGLALHAYHAARNCYPLGVTASLSPLGQSPTKPPGTPLDWSGWSPHAQLLPYLGQTPVYNAINFDFDPFAGQEVNNATANDWKINTFLCPADHHAGTPSRGSMTNLNSYYGSIGINIQSEAHQATGIFAYQALCSERDVTDGLSSTLAFSEGITGDWRSRRYRGNGVINVGTKISDPATRDRLTAAKDTQLLMTNLDACNVAFEGIVGRTSYSGNRGWKWTWGSEGMTLFNTIIPPNSSNYGFNQCRFDCQGCFLQDADHSDITNASSYHPGGANALFCDGTVRFVKGTIAMPTWWALGTRSGGEAVSSDGY